MALTIWMGFRMTKGEDVCVYVCVCVEEENVSTNLVEINKYSFRSGGREREKEKREGLLREKRGFNLEPLYTKRATHTQCTQSSLPNKAFYKFHLPIPLLPTHTHTLTHARQRGGRGG